MLFLIMAKDYKDNLNTLNRSYQAKRVQLGKAHASLDQYRRLNASYKALKACLLDFYGDDLDKLNAGQSIKFTMSGDKKCQRG